MDIVSEAVNLAQRYQKGDAFRHHVEARIGLVLGVLLLCIGFSIALSLGVVALLDKSALRAFLGVLLMPIVLIGSLAVQAYLFFSWLELRALKPMLAHGARPTAKPRVRWLARLLRRLGKPPSVPWIAAAVFLLLPYLALVLVSLKVAVFVLVLAILTPVGYVHLDR
ncbi:MAG TPA: hypothetical protein VEQ87_10890 [Burkholderiales bacterium]|nr:hypothetical protein [Burkholderiales bacterium]